MGPRPKPKATRRLFTVEEKKQIIFKRENGVRATDLAAQYHVNISTISTILKNSARIKAANVAKGVSRVEGWKSTRRTGEIDEMEKLLLAWINEQRAVGKKMSMGRVCKKAKSLYEAVKKSGNCGDVDTYAEFKGTVDVVTFIELFLTVTNEESKSKSHFWLILQ